MMSWFQKADTRYFSYEHDMHSHILPGLDDGVKRMEDAVVIVKKMLGLGVKRFSFTPHVSFPSPLNTPVGIREKLEALRASLAKDGIYIEADAGAEYKVGEYMLDLIDRGDIASFNGGKVLVEHSFVGISPFFEEVVFRLQAKGYTPVLAHPERYPFSSGWVVKFVKDLKYKGCLVQVNLLSFAGFYGKDAERGARELSAAGLIDHVSGDIHSIEQVELLERFLMSKKTGAINFVIDD